MSLNIFAQEPVVDVLHGVTVVDHYRWLEDQNSSMTRAWITEQQRHHDAYFASAPGLRGLHERTSKYLNVEVVDQSVRVGRQLFFRRRKKNQEQACIYVEDGDTGLERLLVDPSSMGLFASVLIHRVSSKGYLLAYELRQGGSDAKEIHFATADGEILPDHLPIGYARGLCFAPDDNGIYYCHEPIQNITEHTVRYHEFGVQSDDPVLYQCSCVPGSRLNLLADEVYLGILYAHDDSGQFSSDMHLAKYADASTWTPVFANKRLQYRPFLYKGRIFILTDHDAPNGKVIELLGDCSKTRLIIPESSSPIRHLAFVGDILYVEHFVEHDTVIDRWTTDGARAGTVEVPTGGSVQILPKLSSNSSSLVYTYESFTTPQAIHEYGPEINGLLPLFESAPAISRIKPVVREVCYRSKDGKSIPMYLVEREDLDYTQPRPSILTSYGGFGVSMTPRFSVLVAILVELGAVFALPKIRGGSEFGKAWHEAARGRRRQVAIDDFVAAAEWLIYQGLTNPHQMGTFGGSNSGLLVAAAMMQRPDLFRAVLCIAPLLDMIRYQEFDRARNWRHEYGTADDPQDFASLYSYSPYHQIKEGMNYPAILFVTGDKDDRCNPAHVRKMAAHLRNREAQTMPVIVDYSSERGHSPVLPLSVRCVALARRIAFLCKELSISLPQEASIETNRD